MKHNIIKVLEIGVEDLLPGTRMHLLETFSRYVDMGSLHENLYGCDEILINIENRIHEVQIQLREIHSLLAKRDACYLRVLDIMAEKYKSCNR